MHNQSKRVFLGRKRELFIFIGALGRQKIGGNVLMQRERVQLVKNAQ